MSRVVYVGHVPFDMTEEQIEDIFKSAGPVEQTRLVFDRASGKSKGFAFVQYFEPESADSAVRNLDNYKIGSMHLKVNYSQGRFPGGGKQRNADSGSAAEEPTDDTGVVPEIVNIVSSLSPAQKLELLSELKSMISESSGDVRLVLDRNPQLAYAVVQSMFELGKIDGSAAGSLIVQPQSTPGPAPQPQAPMQPSQTASPAPQTQPKLSNEQRQMYRQIMQLTQEQLAAMPAEQRSAALAIRSKVETGEIAL